MKKTILMTILLSAAVLTACSTETKKKLGFASEGPDEFMVMSRAPLSLPPEYDLRPVNDMNAVERMNAENRTSGLDASERKLLAKIQVEHNDDEIKAKIEKEFKELNASN